VPSCAERASHAAALVAAHPRIAARLGDRPPVEATLTALEALPGGPSRTAIPTTPRSHCTCDTSCSAQWPSCWTRRPASRAPGLGHVTDEHREQLRERHAALLAERVAALASTRRLPPDPLSLANMVVDGGCAMCRG